MSKLDKLFERAVLVVDRDKRAPLAQLRRLLKIGYTRARRLIQAMKRAGKCPE